MLSSEDVIKNNVINRFSSSINFYLLNKIYIWSKYPFLSKAAFALDALAQSFSVVLQVSLLKRLGDVATVLLDLVCLSLVCFFMSFQRD